MACRGRSSWGSDAVSAWMRSIVGSAKASVLPAPRRATDARWRAHGAENTHARVRALAQARSLSLCASYAIV
eukprot:3076919-Pleurochrysis_carterae.AAC.1